MKSLFFVICLVGICAPNIQLCAQQPPQWKHPSVGEIIPNVSFSNVRDFKRKSVSLKDFEGKWLVVSFWSPGCSNSVRSLSNYNAIYKELSDSIMWFMIGMDLNNNNIEWFYEKLRIARNLRLPMVVDTKLAYSWGIPNVPHNILVDPSGIVRFITDNSDISLEKMRQLIKDEPVHFHEKPLKQNRTRFDPVQNDRHDILHHSVITPWQGERQMQTATLDQWVKLPDSAKTEGYQLVGAPLYWLYNHAYRGRSHWTVTDAGYGTEYLTPIIETTDSSLFKYDRTKGRYNYNLVMPLSKMTADNIMQQMQSDLNKTFGLDASLEIRSIPVWKLIAEPGAIDRLKTAGGKKYYTKANNMFGFTQRNLPPEVLISSISFALMEHYLDPFVPFIDETGLKENYDLIMDSDMSDLQKVRKELKKKGLDLVLGTKNMQVLVIRDAKIQN